MRLIDADALEEQLRDLCEDKNAAMYINTVLDIINDLPTIRYDQEYMRLFEDDGK